MPSAPSSCRRSSGKSLRHFSTASRPTLKPLPLSARGLGRNTERKNMIELGSKVRDKVTGVVGIVTGRHNYLHGCTRLSIQPQELKDGKPVDTTGADEPQCELLEGPGDF